MLEYAKSPKKGPEEKALDVKIKDFLGKSSSDDKSRYAKNNDVDQFQRFLIIFNNKSTVRDATNRSTGSSILHKAVINGFDNFAIALMQEFSGLVNLQDGDGKQGPTNPKKTALHYAVDNGNQLLVDALLQHKADPNLTQRSGETPLFAAVISGKVKMVETLAKVTDLTISSGSGTALIAGLRAQDLKPGIIEALKSMVNVTDAAGRTALDIISEIPGDSKSKQANIKTLTDLGAKHSPYYQGPSVVDHLTKNSFTTEAQKFDDRRSSLGKSSDSDEDSILSPNGSIELSDSVDSYQDHTKIGMGK